MEHGDGDWDGAERSAGGRMSLTGCGICPRLGESSEHRAELGMPSMVANDSERLDDRGVAFISLDADDAGLAKEEPGGCSCDLAPCTHHTTHTTRPDTSDETN